MKRSVLKIICIVSGILFVVFSVFTILIVLQAFSAMNTASMGIIGGADGPTYLFLLQRVAGSPLFYAPLLPLIVFAGTGLALLFGKKAEA